MVAKVFLVTSGDYSDYGVRAVFSTRENAQKYIDSAHGLYDSHDSFDIEEWYMDGPTVPISLFYVEMAKDGTVRRATRRLVMLEKSVHPGYDGIHDPTWNAGVNHDVNLLCWHVQTDDEEKAIKVVAEKRAEVLAAGIWGDSEKMKAYFAAKETSP